MKKLEMNRFMLSAIQRATALDADRVKSVKSYIAHNRANRYFATIQADKKRGGLVIELTADEVITIASSKYASACFTTVDGRVRSTEAVNGWFGAMFKLGVPLRETWRGDYREGLKKCANGSRCEDLERLIAELTGGEWIGAGDKSATATREGEALRKANTFVRSDIKYVDPETGKTIGYGEVKCAAGHWDYIKNDK